MRPLIKEVQYHQFISLIEYSVCDQNCENCDWKKGDYDNLLFECLLKELKYMIPKENKETEDLSKLDYLRDTKKTRE